MRPVNQLTFGDCSDISLPLGLCSAPLDSFSIMFVVACLALGIHGLKSADNVVAKDYAQLRTEVTASSDWLKSYQE